mmetsp:Transcript_6706/g.14335  ORF Transcript_6706/g.14335 Transcript_6706/m.14335 type:complete len:240 (-) Transcript_6706:244-963(-)
MSTLGTPVKEENFSLDMAERMLAELQQGMDSPLFADKENTPQRPPTTTAAKNATKSDGVQKNMNHELRASAHADRSRAGEGKAMNDSDEGMDLPQRLTRGPEAAAAIQDLQRCSVAIAASANAGVHDPNTFARGDLFLRQRFFTTTWKKRFASLVEHAYFGPVLFLFRYDKKGHVNPKMSTMIALADAEVRMGDDCADTNGIFRCQFSLKARRKYILSVNDALMREYWIENLRSFADSA